jgi:hypothetical protein
MDTTSNLKSNKSNGRMIITDMSHLKGKVHFPEKLEKARQILAPLIALEKERDSNSADSNS